MAYLLNLAYLALLIAVSPWLLYTAIRKGKYREGWGAKFFGRVPIRGGDETCLWFHAVSVGEVNVLAPLIMRIEREHPEWTCVISTTTKSGYELARQKYAPRIVFYCPLDFSWAVRRALRRIRPQLLVLAELELWPNLIRCTRSADARVAVINGRLSERSYRGYRRIRPLLRGMLESLDLVAAQNEEYKRRFLDLGSRLDVTHATGSVKFDGAQLDRGNAKTRQLAALWDIAPGDPVFLAGSTQDPEEAIALATFERLRDRHPRLRLIITPRHPERFEEVAQMLEQSGVSYERRSRLDSDACYEDARVLLVDAVGELGAWWGVAQIAYVGGSMGQRGGQNMIEPAAYGAAVSFGPNTWNFRDIVTMMLDREAAVVVHDGEDLTNFVRQCLEDGAFASSLGERSQQLVREQQGAADRTCDLLAAQLTHAIPDQTKRDVA